MEAVMGESRYCSRFNYTTMSERLQQLRQELLDLSLDQHTAGPLVKSSPQPRAINRKLFADAIAFSSQRFQQTESPARSRSRKPPATTEHNGWGNRAPNSSAANFEQDAAHSPLFNALAGVPPPTNRLYVKQSRSRPPYLDQCIHEMHAMQQPRPPLDAINEPIAIHWNANAAGPGQTVPSPALADVSSNPMAYCDQATLTESIRDLTDGSTSPFPFLQTDRPDANPAPPDPIPFSILDMTPIDDVIGFPGACDFAPEQGSVSNPATNALDFVDVADDTLMVLVLEMFSEAILTQRIASAPDHAPAAAIGKWSSQSPLVEVCINVISFGADRSQAALARLSIAVLDTDPKITFDAEIDPYPASTKATTSSSSSSRTDSAVATRPEQHPIHDEVGALRQEKPSSGQQLPTPIPTSPRSKSRSPRKSIASTGVELRLLSPSRRTSSDVEMFQIEAFGATDGPIFEACEEVDFQHDALAESQLVRPPIPPPEQDLVEVVVIVSPETSDVCIAIKVAAASVCIGPRFSSEPRGLRADPESNRITSAEQDCDLDRTADAQSQRHDLMVQECSDHDSILLSSYLEGAVSDSSDPSQISTDSTTSGSGNHNHRLAFRSAVSFGEVVVGSHHDDFSDGEIVPLSLLQNHPLLDYLSDSTDTDLLGCS